jgi:hypothetical protein
MLDRNGMKIKMPTINNNLRKDIVEANRLFIDTHLYFFLK